MPCGDAMFRRSVDGRTVARAIRLGDACETRTIALPLGNVQRARIVCPNGSFDGQVERLRAKVAVLRQAAEIGWSFCFRGILRRGWLGGNRNRSIGGWNWGYP